MTADGSADALAPPSKLRVVGVLGITQTLQWASTYYLPAILAAPMARDLGIGSHWVFGWFAAALLVSGFATSLAKAATPYTFSLPRD